MTRIYYVRHAEPNYDNHNDTLRELTPKGLVDRKLVTEFLADKHIDVVVSSPYKTESATKSAKDNISKCQNGTLKLSLEELAIINVLKTKAQSQILWDFGFRS